MSYFVAKTFQDWERISDPFIKKNRPYLMVRSPAGAERKVRAYTEREYFRMYGEPCAQPLTPSGEAPKPQGPAVKNILGFQKGYIWVFKGDLESADYWFQKTEMCRFHVQFGWYIVSTEEIPCDIPSCIQSVQLPWEKIGNSDGTLLPNDTIQAALSELRCEDSPSQFQGLIGDRLNREVTLLAIYDMGTTQWGVSRLFKFEDANGNQYTWTTGVTKSWGVGDALSIRGTVKAHNIYKGIKQTELTRISEV